VPVVVVLVGVVSVFARRAKNPKVGPPVVGVGVLPVPVPVPAPLPVPPPQPPGAKPKPPMPPQPLKPPELPGAPEPPEPPGAPPKCCPPSNGGTTNAFATNVPLAASTETIVPTTIASELVVPVVEVMPVELRPPGPQLPAACATAAPPSNGTAAAKVIKNFLTTVLPADVRRHGRPDIRVDAR
jgi:hypothetical protein